MLVAMAGVLMTFLPLTLIRFAFLDDYSFLATALRNRDGTFELLASVGRPINGWLLETAFGVANDIDGLRWLRLTGILGIATLAAILSSILAKHGLSIPEAASTSIVICTLPAFQVYASWAQYLGTPWAALAAVGAARFTLRSFDKRGLRRALNALGAAGLFTMAMLVYQPAAMVYWLIVAIDVFTPTTTIRRALVRLSAFGTVAALGLLAGYAAFRIGAARYGLGGDRSALPDDLLAKARWFVTDPLQRALNVGQLSGSRVIAIAVAALMTIGMVLYFRGSMRQRLLLTTACIALVPISYLPNLVTAENWGSFRTQIGLASMIALLAVLAFKGWVSVAPRQHHLKRSLTAWVVSLAAVIGVLSAVDKSLNYFALPQELELRVLTRQLRVIGTSDEIFFVRAAVSDTTAPGSWFDEFGVPSTVALYTPEPLVFLLLQEMHPDLSTPSVAIVDSVGSNDVVATIDMRILSEYR